MPTTTKAQHEARRRSRTQQGITLIEVMIVLTILALIVSGVAVALLPQLEEARIKSTRADAQALRSAVMLYVADNPRSCPSVDDLVNERYLDATKRTTDAWDAPFQVNCESGDVFVVSAGPDGQYETEDDIQ